MKNVTKAHCDKMRKLAEDIIDLLCEHSLFYETNIFIPSTEGDYGLQLTDMGPGEVCHTKNGNAYVVIPDKNVEDYMEYFSKEGITIANESGAFDSDSMDEAIQRLIEDAGLFAEPGYSWSLAGYPEA